MVRKLSKQVSIEGITGIHSLVWSVYQKFEEFKKKGFSDVLPLIDKHTKDLLRAKLKKNLLGDSEMPRFDDSIALILNKKKGYSEQSIIKTQKLIATYIDEMEPEILAHSRARFSLIQPLQINCNNQKPIKCDTDNEAFKSLNNHNAGYHLRATEEDKHVLLELVDEQNRYIHDGKQFLQDAQDFWISKRIRNPRDIPPQNKPSVLVTARITVEGFKPLITTVLPNLIDKGSMCMGSGASGRSVHGEVIACLLLHTFLKHNTIESPSFRKIEMEIKVLGSLQAENTTKMCGNCSELGSLMKNYFGYQNWIMKLK